MSFITLHHCNDPTLGAGSKLGFVGTFNDKCKPQIPKWGCSDWLRAKKCGTQNSLFFRVECRGCFGAIAPSLDALRSSPFRLIAGCLPFGEPHGFAGCRDCRH